VNRPAQLKTSVERSTDADRRKDEEHNAIILNQINTDLDLLISTPAFVRYVTRWATRFRFMQTSFSPQSSSMYQFEARRKCGDEMLADILERNPDVFAEIVKTIAIKRIDTGVLLRDDD